MIVNVSYDSGLAIAAKDSSRAEIVRWGFKTNYEVAGEEVFSQHFLLAVRVNKNVCKWCRRIPYIAASIEHSQKLSDPGVNR